MGFGNCGLMSGPVIECITLKQGGLSCFSCVVAASAQADIDRAVKYWNDYLRRLP